MYASLLKKSRSHKKTRSMFNCSPAAPACCPPACATSHPSARTRCSRASLPRRTCWKFLLPSYHPRKKIGCSADFDPVCAAGEHLEAMAGVFILIESSAMVATARWPRRLVFVTSIEIILSSLSFVWENCIGVADGFESLRSSRRLVLVWVKG